MLDFNPDAIDFESTGNPLYAWAHIHRAWKQGTPLPSWVMEYLGKAAEQLITMKPKTRHHATMVKNALGFNDGRCFRAFHKNPVGKTTKDIATMQAIYDRVNEERRKRPVGEKEKIFADIAVEIFGDSNRTLSVRDFYYEFKEVTEEMEKIQHK